MITKGGNADGSSGWQQAESRRDGSLRVMGPDGNLYVIPMPQAVHLDHADKEPVLRKWLRPGRTTNPSIGFRDGNVRHIFFIYEQLAPAPYVGKPFDYRWRVAVDSLGRGVAGEAWQDYFSPMAWGTRYLRPFLLP